MTQACEEEDAFDENEFDDALPGLGDAKEVARAALGHARGTASDEGGAEVESIFERKSRGGEAEGGGEGGRGGEEGRGGAHEGAGELEYNAEVVGAVLELLGTQTQRRIITAMVAASVLLELLHPKGCGCTNWGREYLDASAPGGSRRLLREEHAAVLRGAVVEAASFMVEMLKTADGGRSRLFVRVAEEQLRSDEGLWLCQRTRAESIMAEAVSTLPPFVGQLPGVDNTKVILKRFCMVTFNMVNKLGH
jgi:hypothetical protein